jgi:HEAT repeats
MSMRIVPLFLCAPLLLLAAGGTAVAQKKPVMTPEPVPVNAQLGGKTLDQWVKEFNAAKDPSKVVNCIQSILQFGPDAAQQALPHLIAILRKHKPTAPIDTSVRVNACIAVGNIVGDSKDRPERKYIQEAVTLLTRQLRDGERIIRYRAAESLGMIGTEAKSAIPELIYNVRDPATWETRQAAAYALGTVAVDREKGPQLIVLQALYGALRDNSASVRMSAVQAIARLGAPKDQKDRLELERALEPVAKYDADLTVQIWAHLAVMGLNGKVEDWRLAAIGKMMHSPELAARMQAAQALGALGKQAKKEIPQLLSGLRDPDVNVVIYSTAALANMGKAAEQALPYLQKLVGDPQQGEFVKRVAQQAIEAIEGKAMQKGIKGANK